MSELYRAESALAIHGVPGRLIVAGDKGAQVWIAQKWISESRPAPGYDSKAVIRAEIRFDDECRNGHNSFAITGEVRIPGRRDVEACGCLHDDIAAIFPELASLIPWHLTSSDGPMHYIANTVYHAGDRDHWGTRQGEPRQWSTVIQFGDNPIKHRLRDSFVQFLQDTRAGHGRPFDYEVIRLDHGDRGKRGAHQFGPKFTFGGYGERWHECPFDDESEALDFLGALQRCNPQFIKIPTAWGEGKARDLKAARDSAVWPDATDEELSVEPDALKAALEARHAALVARFRAAIEGAGLAWNPPA